MAPVRLCPKIKRLTSACGPQLGIQLRKRTEETLEHMPGCDCCQIRCVDRRRVDYWPAAIYAPKARWFKLAGVRV